ncbi:MAG: NAD-dependent epimerase/dehydratase family protein [Pseudomonadota bacterium]
MTSRRDFLETSAALALLGAAAPSVLADHTAKPLSYLVLGGTGFIGPHQINALLDRGHAVTVFNRGRRGGMFGDRVTELVGNRDDRVDDGLKALRSSDTWDVVIDNSGYVPRHVRDSVKLLKDRCRQYLYISTVASYDFDQGPVFDRDGPIYTTVPDTEEVNGETYGPLKAECDRIVLEHGGDQATIVRPTYIVGPGDHTDRFTYWVERVMRGGDVLTMTGPDHNVQWIDVRDLAAFVTHLTEHGTPGVFNAAGPSSRVNNRGLLWGLRALTDKPVTFHWSTPEVLNDLELSMPMFGTESRSLHFDSSAAQAAGLKMRSLADSATAIHEWWQTLPEERRNNPRRWPTPEQESEAIARIRA